MDDFTIEPTDWYDKRATAYVIKDKNGTPVLEASPGGTGDCWNVRNPPQFEDEDAPGDAHNWVLHICELDEVIDALVALRESQAHAENVARWS